MCPNNKNKNSPGIISDIRSEFYDFFVKIPVNIVVLLSVGGILYLLSFTPFGNWLRCNFIDTLGCLPAFSIKSENVQIESCVDLLPKDKEDPWKTTNAEKSDNAVCIRYSLLVRNDNRKGSGDFKIRWEPIFADKEGNTQLRFYRLKGNRGNLFECTEMKTCNEFHLKAIDLTSSDCFKREIAYIDFIIQIPNKLYNKYDKKNPKIIFLLECDQCQAPLKVLRL